MRIEIKQPHGYLLDIDDNVITCFGNWQIGQHKVPDSVTKVEYVDGPDAHKKSAHWQYSSGKLPVEITLSENTIKNDGKNKVIVNIELHEDAEKKYDVVLVIDNTEFEETLTPDEPTTETIVTEKKSGTVIPVYVKGDKIQRTTTHTIKVIQE